MINYKLAKQLKEAGWKQGHKVCVCDHNVHFLAEGKSEKVGCVCNAIPTLSELIEALPVFIKGTGGSPAHLVIRKLDDGAMANYEFIMNDENLKRYGLPETGFFLSEKGKFPKEAMVKLWLKLQKKYHKKKGLTI